MKDDAPKNVYSARENMEDTWVQWKNNEHDENSTRKLIVPQSTYKVSNIPITPYTMANINIYNIWCSVYGGSTPVVLV